jgi:predicted DCC family thiol-disulfide oxidoreductase YuxK
VRYRILPEVLEQEGTQFYPIRNTWKPKGLIPDPYRRNLLKDAQARFERLELAEEEFKTLQNPSRYVKILRRMRLSMRKAHFAWRADDLLFLQSIGEFFTDFGTIFRWLKWEELRGTFEQQPVEQPPKSLVSLGL